MNKFLLNTILALAIVVGFVTCKKPDPFDAYKGSGNEFKGVWVRTLGASGDKTQIAIGNIPGEAANRVYMCEWKGIVGLYKGYLNGNEVTWDSQHGLPVTTFTMKGSQLEFEYRTELNSLPTLYDRGSWDDTHCGRLGK